MRPVIILSTVLVAACASTEPAVKLETVEVKVPVPVYCVTAEQIPADPPSISAALTGNAAADIGPVAIAGLEWKKVATKAKALLQGCVEPK